MHSFYLLVVALQTFWLGYATLAAAHRPQCAPEGPKYSRPRDLDKSVLLQRAIANVTDSIHKALNGTLAAGWNVPNTSFSAAIVSFHTKKPVWEYHHRAKNNVRGTKKVDGDSLYLLGSMSKMVFDLMLTKSDIDLYAPITKFIPELKVNSSKISWKDITVNSLATHMSGIPTNCTLNLSIN